eukprot:COSAG02_NODE_36784_length_450_cov_1.162393_1_plen_79_part_10
MREIAQTNFSTGRPVPVIAHFRVPQTHYETRENAPSTRGRPAFFGGDIRDFSVFWEGSEEGSESEAVSDGGLLALLVKG